MSVFYSLSRQALLNIYLFNIYLIDNSANLGKVIATVRAKIGNTTLIEPFGLGREFCRSVGRDLYH